MGDHLECNGMVRHFAELYNEVTVLAKEQHYDKCVFLYRDTDKIIVQKVRGSLISAMEEEEDINNFLKSFEGDIIMAGFNNYFSRLDYFKEKKYGPAESFYYLAGVPFSFRKEKFYFKRDLIKEEETYLSLNPNKEDFIFIHDDVSRGHQIKINTSLKIIKNDPTKDFFSMMGILACAKEIHCMSSSYFCLLDCMEDSAFEGEKYLHTKTREVELFNSGIQGKWNII
jgi:hypothetical protein